MGKEGGRRGRSIPSLDLGKWWPVAAVLRRRVAAGGGERGGGATELVGGPVPGEKEGGSRGSQSLLWLGPRCCGEGSSAVADVRERRQWRVAALGGQGAAVEVEGVAVELDGGALRPFL